MNIDKINKLADFIEAQDADDLGFDMRYWNPVLAGSHGCGTVACIAGWTCAMERPDLSYWSWGGTPAAEILGLDDPMAHELFTPCSGSLPSGLEYKHIKPPHAVRVLRNLAETGEVDWSVAFATPITE